MTKAQSEAVKSYARALGTAWLAVAVAGVTDWLPYAAALVVAVLAPLARSLDINDPAFGRVLKVVEVAAEEKVEEAVKPVKKAPAKKTTPAVPKG